MRSAGVEVAIVLFSTTGVWKGIVGALKGFCRRPSGGGLVRRRRFARRADTLEWALVQAYQNNPSLNAQRASLRSTDENVPQALSGYRPKLSVTTLGGYNYFVETSQLTLPTGVATTSTWSNVASGSVGVNGSYTLMNGFQTANRTRQAESQVEGARETLRVTEQQVLLDAATAYMNLLHDDAVQDLYRRNVEVLLEQLRQTRDRFRIGELTRTDVAQAESRLAINRFCVSRCAVNGCDLAGKLPACDRS